MKSTEQIDFITGDWMSEGNMTTSALRKLSRENSNLQTYGFEKSFLTSITPHLQGIEVRKVKVVVNAGAAEPDCLCQKLDKVIQDQRLGLQTAWISGDNVLSSLREASSKGQTGLINIKTGEPLEAIPKETVFAQAYLGARGIVKALEKGADIVICGRVADASPAMGAAIWWHQWGPEQHEQHANAFVAGHLIECSTYVTGGNFSGFKTVPGVEDLGFPVAEISDSGEVVITKLAHSGGVVNADTVTAQLLYEIQGPLYYHSDVTAQLDKISLESVGPDRIQLRGVVGLPPPPTTKVGFTGRTRFKAELHWSLVGLDIAAKADLLKENLASSLGKSELSRFSLVNFTTHGVCPEDPTSQNDATVDFRIFVQADSQEDLTYDNWIEPVLNVIMCSYPGATMQPAITAGIPQPYNEYCVRLMPQRMIQHKAHIATNSYAIPPPTVTQIYPVQQQTYEVSEPIDLAILGETVKAPLGFIVHARSGDKGSNANVGFWVRHDDEYNWLRTLLTVKKVKELLGSEYRAGNKMDRFEIPGLRAVHFLLHEHLDRGINSTSTYDILGKNVAEFLRARHVNLPKKFLERGPI
ncbi:uncharacterized protein A1O5_06222 [Cladophialophora psammophila CBS 110553]|uniref:DUF1446 domain-containing protein n=1 Tax=Cladophialophora psammophila CBS 110553 TaxID=1182543 RepID=W9XIG6_9EURO|nr:uncharacterized protein A1O5_06222 [Cladophialophora psammophila CBS 110553]EXJ70154.1 hypothetical protein A1O5_06222 [Cladophialophora psammophila CBS 110553]